MEGRVTHILGIAPYDGMQTAMERVAEEFPNIQLDAYTGDLEAGAAIVRSAQLENYDVIISRGGTADRIREVTDLPVVSIQLSVYDVLRAIKMAENYSNLYASPSRPTPCATCCGWIWTSSPSTAWTRPTAPWTGCGKGATRWWSATWSPTPWPGRKASTPSSSPPGSKASTTLLPRRSRSATASARCAGRTSCWRGWPAPAAATPSSWTRTASWPMPPKKSRTPGCWSCCGPRSPTSLRRRRCGFSTARGASSPG